MIFKQYLAIFSCSGLILAAIAAAQFQSPSASQTLGSPSSTWQGSFNSPLWQQDWQVLSRGQWGMENAMVKSDSTGRFKSVLRVTYPAGSASPQVATLGAPLGGAQFLAALGRSPKEARKLRYFLRFSPGFDFVKGGKLPGFYGGSANSGGDIPTGYDGFSSRLMWREQGYGEIYAYLPSSDGYGTSLGRKTWQFRPGVWHEVEQELRLNKPGKANGSIQIWVDKQPVFKAEKLNFRSTTKLKIDGVFFSTFFGGSDRSWATPKTVYIDFAEFSVVDV
jgi:hypothetical protein